MRHKKYDAFWVKCIIRLVSSTLALPEQATPALGSVQGPVARRLASSRRRASSSMTAIATSGLVFR